MISLVAPANNEAENLPIFLEKTFAAAKTWRGKFEVIIVDDGSIDGSWALLKKLKADFGQLKAVKLRRQSGQTAALMAGLGQAKGEIIVTLDADLQHDPKDLIKLLREIKRPEVDIVSGQRPKERRSLVYGLISRVEKNLIRSWLKIDLADTNISPNAFRRKVLDQVNLIGDMHRFLIPILAWQGYKIVAVPVSFHRRHAGQSKYRPTKAFGGFLDLLVVKFWLDYSVRPIRLFGSLGLSLIGAGMITGIFTIIRKFIFDLTNFNVSLLLLAILFVVVGLLIFIFGILTDMLSRLYYQKNSSYQIDKVL